MRVVASGNTSNAAPVSVGQLRSVAAVVAAFMTMSREDAERVIEEIDGVIDVLYEPDRYGVPETFGDMCAQVLDAIDVFRHSQATTIDALEGFQLTAQSGD